MPSTDENKRTVERWFAEVWGAKSQEAIDELLCDDAILHGLGPDALRGRAGFRTMHAAFVAAFPDIRIAVDELVAEGDRVAVRCTAVATHARSGRKVRVSGGGIVRLRDGRIAEGWNTWDFLGMLAQVGSVAPDAMEKALG